MSSVVHYNLKGIAGKSNDMGRNSTLHIRSRAQKRQGLNRYVLAILAAFLLVVPLAQASASGDITVTHTVTVTDISRADAIPLVSLSTQPSGAGATAFELAWKKDASAWFPTWGLHLTSGEGLLRGANASSIQLSRTGPTAGNTFEVTLSYSPSLGAVAVKVLDTTDNRVVFADTVEAAAFSDQLYASVGTTSPVYLPVGTTWNSGQGTPGGTFLPLYVFETRDAEAVVRLTTPAPLPTGQYRIWLEDSGEEILVADLTPESRETWIPIPLDRLSLGASVLRLEYVADGQVLLSESKPVILGRLDFWMHPVATERADGVVKATFSVRSAEPFDEEITVDVRASIAELVWNSDRKQFDVVPYDEQGVYVGNIDLSQGSTDITLDVPLPDREGNWQVTVTPAVQPEIAAHVSGNERLFSTHAVPEIAEGDSYTIAIFPDTQYFSQNHPHIYTRMTDWVTANADEYNIAALLHMGDITNRNTTGEWERAFRSMSLLHDVVPYVLSIGNHDMILGSEVVRRGDTRINSYFTEEAAKRYSNLGGTMVPGRIENSYSLFSIAGDDYLVISLEFGPPDEALEWANEVAKAYPEHRLILVTHSYLSRGGGMSLSPSGYPIAENPDTTVNSSVGIWEKFLRWHPNTFMVLSGHTSPDLPVVPYRTPRGYNGQVVYEMLFDFQNQGDTRGDGWLGLLTFHPDNTLQVRLVSPYLDQWGAYRDGNGFTSQMEINLDTGLVRRIWN